MINKALIETSPRFANRLPVNPHHSSVRGNRFSGQESAKAVTTNQVGSNRQEQAAEYKAQYQQGRLFG